jgi:hypothetical protein
MIEPVPSELLLAARESPVAECPGQVPASNGKGFTMRAGKVDPVARCRAYLKKVGPAVSGEHGHDRTFMAARLIWADFAIDEAEGYPLLQEFNQTCGPPWDEKDLRRKWNEAVAKGGERCSKLKNRQEETDTPVPPSPPPASPAPVAARSGLPDILHTGRQYRDVEFEAASALMAANKPPFIFVGNGGVLVDLQRFDPDRPPRARDLDGPALRPVFAQVANWHKEVRTKHGKAIEEDFPPTALLTSFPARGNWPGIPQLRCVVPYPVFSPDWELIATEGYHSESGIYCHLGDLEIPAVPIQPTDSDMAVAKELILGDLLGDFPFADQASRAHAIAMLILPIVRHTIDGPTPLAVADAPAEGTGKSLLVEACLLATLGEIPEAMTADMKEEERDKTLLALLIEGQPVVFFDNANRKLDSGAFANTLTARYKRGRILGETRTAHARVNVCWILTGNNFTCSREIARRLYWIRLDAGVETPSERTGFRHEDLLGWVRLNPPRLLWALLVLVQHWRAGDALPGTNLLGKFELWARTVGGILAAAGIPGFLDNVAAFRRICADTVGELAEFVKRWWASYGDSPVIAGQLFDMARDSLESVLTAETEDGKRKQLGRFLKKHRDRVVGTHRVRAAVDDEGKAITDHAGRPRYRLELVGHANSNSDTPIVRDLGDLDPPG